MGFTGEQTDSTGLVYLRARHYNPALGVFMSKDPVLGVVGGKSGHFNGYSYVNGNPVNVTDPSGQIAIVDDLIGIAAIAVVGGLIAATVSSLHAMAIYDMAMTGACGCDVQRQLNQIGRDEFINQAAEQGLFWGSVGSIVAATLAPVAIALESVGAIHGVADGIGDIARNGLNPCNAVNTLLNGAGLLTAGKLGYDYLDNVTTPQTRTSVRTPDSNILDEFEFDSNGNIRQAPPVSDPPATYALKDASKNGLIVARKVADGDCSFSPDTLVTTPDGDIVISELEVGDTVLAYDETTGETGEYDITAVHVHTDEITVYLTIDGEVIGTTPEHPFYTLEHGWIAAGNLAVGDTILALDGDTGSVEKVTFIAQPQEMYNLTVEEVHTFGVGDGQWVVHNTCALQKIGGFGRDVVGKGFHINYSNKGKKLDELRLTPIKKLDGTYEIMVAGKKVNVTNKIVSEVENLLTSKPDEVLALSEQFKRVISDFKKLKSVERVKEADLWLEIFTPDSAGNIKQFTVVAAP